jgi:hypothetical protein
MNPDIPFSLFLVKSPHFVKFLAITGYYFALHAICRYLCPDFGVTVSHSRTVSKRESGANPELCPQL